MKVSGSAVSFTDEATTADGARIRYQITDTVKRVWDPTVAVVVERDTGGGFGAVASTEYTLNRLTGTVVFGVAQAVGTAIRVDGSYLPLSTAAEAKSYTWELVGTNADAGVFGDDWMKRVQIRRDVRGTIGQWRSTDAFFETQLLAGNPVVLQFYADASLSPEMSAFAFLSPQEIQAVVDGLIEQTVTFNGSTDTDGRAVSYG